MKRSTLRSCNRIEQEELDCRGQHALVGEDKSRPVGGLWCEGALKAVLADPDADRQRIEERRGIGFLLRSGLRRLLASPSARSTRHTQLCHRSGEAAG